MSISVGSIPANVRFEAYRGDSFRRVVLVKDGSAAYDLTAWAIRMSIKSFVDDVELIGLFIGEGITVVAVAGRIQIDIGELDLAAGDYRFDLQIENTGDGFRRTLLAGVFSVAEETTVAQ
jgi:hypothetical protein